MPGHAPSLDPAALARLRELVRSLRAASEAGGPLPMSNLVQLANDVQTTAGVTIDFDAEKTLGSPLVVLRVAEPAPAPAVAANLSKRELQVAALVAKGLANKQIASQLRLSLATVKDHVHSILAKTGVPNRAAIAAAYAAASR